MQPQCFNQILTSVLCPGSCVPVVWQVHDWSRGQWVGVDKYMTDAEFSELELVFWRVSQGSLWVDNQVRVGAEQTSKSEKNPSKILILQNLILASHQFWIDESFWNLLWAQQCDCWALSTIWVWFVNLCVDKKLWDLNLKKIFVRFAVLCRPPGWCEGAPGTHATRMGWSMARAAIMILFLFSLNHVDGLVQDCGISSAYALEIPQFWTKPKFTNILYHINCYSM